MARARNIKPGFFKNPELVELSFECRLLFIGLWCLADREGRLEDRPKQIRMEIFPGDDVDVADGLQALHDKELIVRYEAQGQSLVWIPGFAEHQHPHPKEVPSTLPPYLGPEKGGTHDLFAGESNGKVRPSRGKVRASPSDVLIAFPSDIPHSSPSGEAASAKPDAVASLPLIDKTDYLVTAADVEAWREVYPAVDVRLHVLRMREWCLSHPTQRKTRKGARKFITDWLAKEQDRGRGPQASRSDPRNLVEFNRASADAFVRDREGMPE